MITGMETGTPGLGSGAVLIWLKEGFEPRNGLFETRSGGTDPEPVAWSRFDLALSFAMHDPRTDERVPWIKADGRVIRPGELREIFIRGQGCLS